MQLVLQLVRELDSAQTALIDDFSAPTGILSRIRSRTCRWRRSPRRSWTDPRSSPIRPLSASSWSVFWPIHSSPTANAIPPSSPTSVEQTLLGNASELKERSIGIEVFGRSPSYDANADPVVRITAGEVRKRLSQYYYDSSHEGELVVELPIGSYVPVFHSAPDAAGRGPVESPQPSPCRPATSLSLPARFAPPPLPRYPPPSPWRLRWLVAALFVVLCRRSRPRHRPPLPSEPPVPPPSNIDRFWEPVISSANPATFCLGEPAKNLDTDSINDFEAPVSKPEPEKLYVRLHYSGNLALADVITLTRAAAAARDSAQDLSRRPRLRSYLRPAARRPHRPDRRLRQYLDSARHAETALRF